MRKEHHTCLKEREYDTIGTREYTKMRVSKSMEFIFLPKNDTNKRMGHLIVSDHHEPEQYQR